MQRYDTQVSEDRRTELRGSGTYTEVYQDSEEEKEGGEASKQASRIQTNREQRYDRQVCENRGNKGVELTIQSKESGREENERN